MHPLKANLNLNYEKDMHVDFKWLTKNKIILFNYNWQELVQSAAQKKNIIHACKHTKRLAGVMNARKCSSRSDSVGIKQVVWVPSSTAKPLE